MKTKREKYIDSMHDNNVRTGKRILDATRAGNRSLLLVSGPQEGKTDAIISFLIAMEETIGEPINAAWIIATSDNSVKRQTGIDRVSQSGLNGTIVYHHPDTYRNLLRHTSENGSPSILIIDECHYALGKDKPLHEYLKKIGVDYGKPPSEWRNKEIIVLSVSATPYAQSVQSTIHSGSFVVVNYDRAENYFSLEDILDSENCRESEKVLDKHNMLTDFARSLVDKFLSETDKNPGYMIVRLNEPDKSNFVKEIETNYGSYVEIESYDSVNGNIESLYSQLREGPRSVSKIMVISGTARVGKTFDDEMVRNIHTVVETSSSSRPNADTTAQAMPGRLCGYNRKSMPYIYCDRNSLFEAVSFYNNMGTSVPSGRNTRTNILRRNKIEILGEDRDSAKEKISEMLPGIRISVTTCSRMGSQNVASDILSGNRRNIGNDGSYRIYYLDGPFFDGNKDHTDAWNLLTKHRPELIGKFVHVTEEIETEFEPLKNILLKEGLLFA